MKSLKYVCLVVLLLSISLTCFAKQLSFKGKWNRKQKSIVLDIPIEAFIDEKSKELSLQFLDNLGVVYVTITNGNGEVVHNEAVDTYNAPSIRIQLGDDAGNECVLSVTDGRNEVYGEINLNNI